MEFRIPVIVLTLAFLGFIAAGSVEEECGSNCESCYLNDPFVATSCTKTCINYQGTFTCPNTKREALSLKEQVEAVNTEWAKYMDTENDEALRAMHTDNASFVILTAGVTSGFGISDLIEGYNAWHYANTNLVRMDSPVEVAAEGSGLVIGYGPLNFYDKEGIKVFTYKRVYIYNRVGDKLLGYLDIIFE